MPSLLPALTAPPALASLPDEERQRALERFHLIQPHLEEGHSLTQVAEQAGIPYRKVQRWASLYRRFGLAALARKGRSDCGTRRALSPQMQTVVEALALQKPPLPITALYWRVCQVAEEQTEKPPSYAVVYDIVRQPPADLVMLAHEGTKAYADAFEMIHRREAELPNAIWQADHTLLDILLVRGDGATAKPWLTVIIDDYSRAVADYFLSFDSPSALQTALALRQAIWRKEDGRWQICGIPDVALHGQRQRFHISSHGASGRRHQDAARVLDAWKASGQGTHRAVLLDAEFDVPDWASGIHRERRQSEQRRDLWAAYLDVCQVGPAVAGVFAQYLPEARAQRDKDGTERALGTGRLSAAHAGIPGAARFAAADSDQCPQGSSRRHPLSGAALHRDYAGRVHWKVRDAAL